MTDDEKMMHDHTTANAQLTQFIKGLLGQNLEPHAIVVALMQQTFNLKAPGHQLCSDHELCQMCLSYAHNRAAHADDQATILMSMEAGGNVH